MGVFLFGILRYSGKTCAVTRSFILLIVASVVLWSQVVPRATVNIAEACHNSNHSSVPRGIIDSYCVLPWVMWEAVTVVEGIP